MSGGQHLLQPIGWVRSPLVDLAAAPRQGDEGAPQADLVFFAEFVEGLKDLHAGEEIWLLTWLDRARRDVLVVHPRDDLHPSAARRLQHEVGRPSQPCWSSPSRDPSIDGSTVTVSHLEAVDGTPIIDVKPTLGPTSER